jgi:hypothetical protein
MRTHSQCGLLRRAVRSAIVHSAVAVAIASSAGALSPALAEDAAPNPTQASSSDKLEEIVVTGFRESLNLALDKKREEIGAVDAIMAEDIAYTDAYVDTDNLVSRYRHTGREILRGVRYTY